MKNLLKIGIILFVAFMTGSALSARIYWGPNYGHRAWMPVRHFDGWHYRHFYPYHYYPYWYHRSRIIWVPAHWSRHGWVPGHWRRIW